MRRAAMILASGLILSGAIVGGRWAVHQRGEPAPGPLPDTTGSIPSEPAGPGPLKPGEPIPDAILVNQDGQTVHLSDFKGRTLVLSFIYTRCNMTTMCPLATRKLREAQTLARENGLDVHFLIVSFDPEDGPEVLRDYARRNDVDLSNWDFATGPRDGVGPLARRFNTYYRRTPGGSFEHNIMVSIVDPRGRLRDDFFGTEWDTKDFIRALREAHP